MFVHLVLDGVADGPLGIGLDVVSTAARLTKLGMAPTGTRQASFRQCVVSTDGRPVRSANGRPVAVDGALGSVKAGDVIVLPGLSASHEDAVSRLLARPDTAAACSRLARAAAKGALIGASCSATFVLAAAGVLADRRATTTWWLVPSFARRFPDVTPSAEHMVVEDGGVFTAGSAFAHADLMLALVTRVGSPALAELVARYLVLDERPSQARYMVIEHLRAADPAIAAIERFVATNLERQVGLDELAHAAATSPRTLARRVRAAVGTTPLELVQRIRVAHAAHLLETTRTPVDEIAARVGYADPAAFRRVFRRHAGEAPRERRHGR